MTTKQGLNEVVVSAKARLGHSDIPIPRRGENKVPLPPGPGNALTLRKFLSPTRTPWFLADIANEYPDLAYMRFFGMDRYVVNSPELIVETFVNHANDLIKGPAFDGLKPIVGNGLLTAEGPTHLAHRRLVQPAFHRDRIAEYSSSIVELSLVHEKSWSPGQRVDMASEMVALTLAVVGRTLFGTDLSGDASAVGQSLRQLLHISNRYSAFGPALWRYPSPARSQLAQALATMDVVIDRIISENRAGSETGGMMSLLLSAQEDGDAFTDAQVRDEVMTLVSAGHETTAMTLTWAWLLLAQNAPELNWLHDELDEVLCGRPPTMEDLVRLPRTRAVIAEAIRLYPPIWLFGRRALTNIELGGWQVPEGANVMVSPFAIHRSPRFWPNASSFQPDRWIGEDGAFDEHRPGVPRGAWIPFGFGKRKCIGEQFAWTESMLVLATLAQTWSPRLATDRPVKPETALSLRPKGGLPMVLERRSIAGSK